MKIALSQSLFRLGDFESNYKKSLESLEKALQDKVDLLVFPEGGLWGYPPKDFLYHKIFYDIQEQKLKQLKKKLPSFLHLLMPGFRQSKNKLENGVFLLKKQGPIRFFSKEFLPNEEVFFESRYFQKGHLENNFFYLKKKRIQLLVCEDFWQNKLFRKKNFKKPDLFLSVNASPYSCNKKEARLKRLKSLARQSSLGAIYLNLVGAQDSLIFDGASLALDKKGTPIWQGAFFKPDFKVLSFLSKTSSSLSPFNSKKKNQALELQEEREQALILGIKEFFLQTGHSKACLGLSGGIDSALVAYLTVQALGSDKVQAYFLPSRFTKKISYQIVEELSEKLDLKVIQKKLDPLMKFYQKDFLNQNLKSLTKQNLQSRLRLLYLMTQSNENGSLLLGTGNKSELALGYSTLYGDLSGALLPIADLFKTEVYLICLAINKKTTVFPKKLLLREPSAELAPGQTDSQDLGSYKEIDLFLKTYLEKKALTKPSQRHWLKQVQSQEFKRKQAPYLLKISQQDLGESWRYPVAHHFPLK